MAAEIEPELLKAISESKVNNQRLVILTCGVCGAGKSTLSRALVALNSNFVRLSIDLYIFENHGLYDTDYDRSLYETFQEEASRVLKEEFRCLLKEGRRDVVLDFAFWNKGYRDEWRRCVEEVERENERKIRTVIVYFEVSEHEDLLWKRVQERNKGEKNADSAVQIKRELLRKYVSGFEKPLEGIEGEVVVVGVE